MVSCISIIKIRSASLHHRSLYCAVVICMYLYFLQAVYHIQKGIVIWSWFQPLIFGHGILSLVFCPWYFVHGIFAMVFWPSIWIWIWILDSILAIQYRHSFVCGTPNVIVTFNNLTNWNIKLNTVNLEK